MLVPSLRKVMDRAIAVPQRVAFGLFQADLRTGELWKGDYRVKLQGQPFKVLAILIEHAGEIVTREELQLQVWGPDIAVDFDQSLGSAIRKVRDAIGDSADNPRFVETLPRRGFRFIAPVRVVETSSATQPLIVAESEVRASSEPLRPAIQNTSPSRDLRGILIGLAIGLGGLMLGAVLRFWSPSPVPATLPRVVQITKDGLLYTPKDNLLSTLSALVTDGARLFTPTNKNGQVVLSQVSVTSGVAQTVLLPSQLREPEAEDISPDGTKLLVRSNLASTVPQPLWVMNVDQNSIFKIPNIRVQDAIWMPDGRGILYTFGNQIAVLSLDDGRSSLLATVSQRAFWPRWSPDGKLLRFTVIDPVSHASSLWELPRGQDVAHSILKSSDASLRTCCGVWTADGKYFVFEQTSDGNTDLWKVNASLTSAPVQITNGPSDYMAPSPGRKGEQIFFVGKDTHSLLESYDPEHREYVAEQGFLSQAERVRYSRDGVWVAWVDPEHHLWRARADGTDRVLLTPPSLRVFVASWSPDNTRLAIMARRTAQPWQIYMVNADGSPPEQLLQENRNIGDPSFSPDGKYLVFGTVADLIGDVKTPRSLEIMELATHQVSEIAHSEGLFSPAWSPDGRFIVAITLDQNKLMLNDTKTSLWTTLAVTSASWPVWSKDSKAVYIHAYQAENEPILRVGVPDGKMEMITNLKNFRVDTITHANFAGITTNNIPLMHAEIASGNLYTLDLGQK